MTHDDLVTFRARHAGCEVALLADVSARTVLLSDTALKLGQDYLEGLCLTACCVFATGAGLAMLAGPTGTQVFLRGVHEEGEALICVFAPLVVLDGVAEEMTVLLNTAPPDALRA